MACPICGANCKCKNRGPHGLCCSCHRHKPSAAAMDAWSRTSATIWPEVWKSYEQHKEWLLEAENVKTVGDAMAKKKDRRNGHESGSWHPNTWRKDKIAHKREDALRFAFWQLCDELGEYRAALIIAETRGSVGAAVSRAAFEAANVPVIGA